MTEIDPRKYPRQARSTAMVEAIVEAAARILETAGPEGFNTNAIAERAGVSIGSLYQYFPSKQALVAALIRTERQTFLNALHKHKLAAGEGTLEAMLEGFIDAAVNHQLLRPALSNHLELAETSLPLDPETQELNVSITRLIASVLKDHDIDRPDTAAQDIFAMAHGMVDSAGRAGETDRADLAARLKRAVWGYLALPSEPVR
ncbi:TetR/AcrR family transcriptional regulator [Allorhizobium sp. BGMRC 0089]|uniref:TetR/AcrR family transcriptional regulator n=1 Tax=Allorhizobium sonneratiae TaxID=2934936 RepID=UPI0020340502|nr:TetR/AcrR family transcriptional regulator [Allorhizobium sonneratiae]MCM2293444.1 TetR/AcrR family transcriptional regulator [Allorhizobium sonneratiae]